MVEEERKETPYTCKGCGQESMLSLTEARKTRPVEGLPLITEHGVECPQCGDWEHLFYTDTALQKKLDRLEKMANGEKSQDNYMKKFMSTMKSFNHFQERVERRLKKHGAKPHAEEDGAAPKRGRDR